MDRRIKNIDTKWSHSLAYVLGVIATDGNLSPDLRHINVTSKDLEMLLNIKSVLKLRNKIGRKGRGGSQEKKYYVLQFGSKNFFSFLLGIGLTPAKSKTLGVLFIPSQHFPSFLRGCIDGDGNIYEFSHPESRMPQLRVRLVSASKSFLEWVAEMVRSTTKISGGWLSPISKKSVYTLSFGKNDSIQILRCMYAEPEVPRLTRKYRLAQKYLGE